MKLNKQKNKDYYVFLEDGEIIEEEKDKDSLKIMNHHDSDNSDSINNEDNSKKQKDFYDNLSKYCNKLPNKKTFNIIILSLISIISILIIFNIIGIVKSVHDTSMDDFNLNSTSIKISSKDREQLFFMANIVKNSNSSLKNYYDDINKLIKQSNGQFLNSRINQTKNDIENNLNELKTLNQYVDVKLFNSVIKLLEDRFNNALELCVILSNPASSSNIENYNYYASKEIELQKEQILILSKYFDKLKIEYEITSDNSLIYKTE